MSSSSDGHEHIRILQFQDGSNTSVIAYMLQENDAGKPLDRQFFQKPSTGVHENCRMLFPFLCRTNLLGHASAYTCQYLHEA